MNRKLLVLSMTSAAILGTAIGVTSIKESPLLKPRASSIPSECSHSNYEHYDAVQSTILERGRNEYWVCCNCHASFDHEPTANDDDFLPDTEGNDPFDLFDGRHMRKKETVLSYATVKNNIAGVITDNVNSDAGYTSANSYNLNKGEAQKFAFVDMDLSIYEEVRFSFFYNKDGGYVWLFGNDSEAILQFEKHTSWDEVVLKLNSSNKFDLYINNTLKTQNYLDADANLNVFKFSCWGEVLVSEVRGSLKEAYEKEIMYINECALASHATTSYETDYPIDYFVTNKNAYLSSGSNKTDLPLFQATDPLMFEKMFFYVRPIEGSTGKMTSADKFQMKLGNDGNTYFYMPNYWTRIDVLKNDNNTWNLQDERGNVMLSNVASENLKIEQHYSKFVVSALYGIVDPTYERITVGLTNTITGQTNYQYIPKGLSLVSVSPEAVDGFRFSHYEVDGSPFEIDTPINEAITINMVYDVYTTDVDATAIEKIFDLSNASQNGKTIYNTPGCNLTAQWPNAGDYTEFATRGEAGVVDYKVVIPAMNYIKYRFVTFALKPANGATTMTCEGGVVYSNKVSATYNISIHDHALYNGSTLVAELPKDVLLGNSPLVFDITRISNNKDSSSVKFYSFYACYKPVTESIKKVDFMHNDSIVSTEYVQAGEYAYNNCSLEGLVADAEGMEYCLNDQPYNFTDTAITEDSIVTAKFWKYADGQTDYMETKLVMANYATECKNNTQSDPNNPAGTGWGGKISKEIVAGYGLPLEFEGRVAGTTRYYWHLPKFNYNAYPYVEMVCKNTWSTCDLYYNGTKINSSTIKSSAISILVIKDGKIYWGSFGGISVDADVLNGTKELVLGFDNKGGTNDGFQVSNIVVYREYID